MTTTMFAPNVFMRWERDTGATALRTIVPTLEEAKAILDAECERAGKEMPQWKDEFGGSSATIGELTYEVVPVQVRLP